MALRISSAKVIRTLGHSSILRLITNRKQIQKRKDVYFWKDGRLFRISMVAEHQTHSEESVRGDIHSDQSVDNSGGNIYFRGLPAQHQAILDTLEPVLDLNSGVTTHALDGLYSQLWIL